MAVPVSKTYPEWELSTFVLDVGQIGYDSTNNEHRIGNGIDTFFNLNKSQLNPDNFIFVKSKSDLPIAISSAIPLRDNATYFFCTTVDLFGDRLVAGQNTTIIGGSSENCRIKSTGLSASTALITSEWSLPMRNITIEHGTAIDLDATGNANQALDWFGVNFTDCETVGTIKGYNNFIATDCALLNSGTLTFDGTTGTVGFQSCIFDAAATKTLISIPSTATITRRFRIIYSAFVVSSGETGINVSTSATIPVEGYILDTVNFSGGGTYTTGVTYSDNKSLFNECKGIINSANIAEYYMQNNATATTISLTNTFYKIAGTTTDGTYIQRFTDTNNRATYTGAISRYFKVSATISATAGNNQELTFAVAVNGIVSTASQSTTTTSGAGKSENGKTQDVVFLNQNDYVEIWVANSNLTDVTAEQLSVIIEALN